MTKIKKRKNKKESFEPEVFTIPSIPFPRWGIVETGYTPITTLWQDFSIADAFGLKAIKDTYRQVLRVCRWDYRYQTELVLVLSWKVGCWYEKNIDIAELYNELWLEADAWAFENLKGEELRYFIQTID